MKLQINNSTGAVVLYPATEPSPRAGFTIIEVTPEIQAVIDAGGPFLWQMPEPVEGIFDVAAGTLVKTTPPPPPVPSEVTPRQIRLALIDRGIMPEQITQMLSGIEDSVLRAKSLAEWEYAHAVKRNHPLIAQLGGALSFTSEDVDALFREAKAIGG